jgi:hypothetical protein
LAPSTRDPPLPLDFWVFIDISILYLCLLGVARESCIAVQPRRSIRGLQDDRPPRTVLALPEQIPRDERSPVIPEPSTS